VNGLLVREIGKEGTFLAILYIVSIVWISPAWAQQSKQPIPSEKLASVLSEESMNPRPADGQASDQKRPERLMQPAEPTPLEDLILEKGIITMDDWLRIKAAEERKALQEQAELQMAGSPRWYERIRINGYVQTRWAIRSNDSKFDIPLGDKLATSDPNQFYTRRIRLVLQGQVSERLSFYFQPAFEGDGQNMFNKEVIDAFADYNLTRDRKFRIRLGLQRTPNSFDTYRSSSNRQELDRHESVQSGAPGERDLGASFFWTSKVAQERYAQLATYHNGPGDYGNFGIMVWNGQTRNKSELNGDKHVGLRLAHPWELPNGRLVETGMFAYRGIFAVTGLGALNSTSKDRCATQLRSNSGCNVLDERMSWYIWTPPQPWGVLAEFTVGRGPKRNAKGIVEESSLHGGYVQGYYTWQYSDVGMLTPYIRWGEYYGGFKTIEGRDGQSRSWNFGLVWDPDTHWRFVTELMLKNGLNTNSTYVAFNQAQQDFDGSLVRFQAQWFFN